MQSNIQNYQGGGYVFIDATTKRPLTHEFRKDYGEEWFGRTGLTYSENIKIYKTAGCEGCSNTGYSSSRIR